MGRSLKAVRGSVVPEYEGNQLGDERRSKRVLTIARRLQDDPRAGFPSSMHSTAELEAFYRFINNHDFSADEIVAPHREAALARASREKVVTVVHDTTPVEFSGRTPRPGLGITTTKHRYGFLAHVSLLVTADGTRTPLGVVGFETFTRTGTKRKRVEKSRTKVQVDPSRESLRWWRGVEELEKQRGELFEAVHVMDAEADFYELLYRMQQAGARFVIRAGQAQRTIVHGGETVRLRDVADSMVPRIWRTVELNARQHTKHRPRAIRARHPERAARKARLAIASAPVELTHTRYSGIKGSVVRLTLVRVWEPEPAEGTPAVEWLLLTAEDTSTRAALIRVVDIYRSRWIVEEYFKALKSGCALEQRQVDSYEALRKVMALFVPIAYRLLLLRGIHRRQPRAPAKAFFSDVELALLSSDDSTRELGSLHSVEDGLLFLARMGGHLKHNGPPGWITLARGYERLVTLRAGWEAAMVAQAHRRSDQS